LKARVAGASERCKSSRPEINSLNLECGGVWRNPNFFPLPTHRNPQLSNPKPPSSVLPVLWSQIPFLLICVNSSCVFKARIHCIPNICSPKVLSCPRTRSTPTPSLSQTSIPVLCMCNVFVAHSPSPSPASFPKWSSFPQLLILAYARMLPYASILHTHTPRYYSLLGPFSSKFFSLRIVIRANVVYILERSSLSPYRLDLCLSPLSYFRVAFCILRNLMFLPWYSWI